MDKPSLGAGRRGARGTMGDEDDDVLPFARAMMYANGASALSLAKRAVELQRQLDRPDRLEWWLRVVDALEKFR
jgi:hypothetical protein